MNSFSFKRCGKMLRWLICVNRVSLLGFTVGVAFSIFLLQLISFIFGSFQTIVPYIQRCADFGSFLIPFALLIIASNAFTNFTSIGTKQQRGTFLMIPATNLEKYLALMVYIVVVCGLCAIVGYILGDCLRMASLWVWAMASNDPSFIACEVFNFNGVDQIYYLWSSTVPSLFSKMTPHLITVWTNAINWDWYVWANLLVHVMLAVWTHSLFTLGGTLLRKYAFIISGAIWMTFMIVFMWTLSHFNLTVTQTVWDGDKYVGNAIGVMAYVLMVAFPLFSIFNYWASFHIFKGFQLITNKWFNYDILKR
jgi:hypothetical protein